ncbi:MAG: cupin domain-containing protein [Acidobacteria bacterium]|nr:cupin domain-containing protein [Acidobacteriota bacterium]
MTEIEKWDESKWGVLTESNMRRVLESRGYAVSKYTYPPGTYFPDHTHAIDKIDTVLKGRFLIRAEGGDHLLGPGDMIAVPAGTVHSAEVIGHETVVSLDATRSR